MGPRSRCSTGFTDLSKSKRTGTQWETDVVRYLRERGYQDAERRALSGISDKGDIINAGPYTWECKNTATIDLAGGIEETKVETRNAGTRYGFLIVKRRRKPVSEGYAVMTLAQLCDLLNELEDLGGRTSK